MTIKRNKKCCFTFQWVHHFHQFHLWETPEVERWNCYLKVHEEQKIVFALHKPSWTYSHSASAGQWWTLSKRLDWGSKVKSSNVNFAVTHLAIQLKIYSDSEIKDQTAWSIQDHLSQLKMLFSLTPCSGECINCVKCDIMTSPQIDKLFPSIMLLKTMLFLLIINLTIAKVPFHHAVH